MVKIFPNILALGIERLKNRINELKELGYSESEAFYITRIFPVIFSYDIKKMKNNVDEIISFGYSYDEVVKMFLALPSLFGLKIDTIREKWEFYNSVDLSDIFIVKPKYLIQSVELSYARYMFYKDKEINITMDNYSILFINQGDFYKKYKIEKGELLELYSYKNKGLCKIKK